MYVIISGDLVNDEIDIAVSSLTITSSREEVVDFITPYFDQSGISIVGRKPVRPRSLFKFLEVLHVEVHNAFHPKNLHFSNYLDRYTILLITSTIKYSRYGWQL